MDTAVVKRIMDLAETSSSRSSAEDPILNIAGAAKTFSTSAGHPKIALRPVDLEIRRGEFVSLVGPSGCGKTTLLKMCAGLIAPTIGTIDFAGTGRAITPAAMGMVFQTPALLPWRTILANVMLPADILKLGKRDHRARAVELLRLVHLDGATDSYPHELSGGMQQRASLARALFHEPDVLLMDEPFGALDAMTRESLNLELQRVHMTEKKTVLFVTHSISEAVLLSDRIVVMSSSPGRVVDVLDVPFERPRAAGIQTTLGFQQIADHVRRLLDLAGVPE
ncbi:ABC transporter ATP-binding protein [Cryobacterium sp. N21]|uniref:ABC transporter ATP-binding protein n=1 Tax=Cryobacterium sp. N21 TaxID=2048289 RepID=UPI0018EAFEE9|nr:ABC transporter ATP-binding protein [Cryobacterium sp. N21]